jgi:flagellar hook-basal body complex protein FliE
MTVQFGNAVSAYNAAAKRAAEAGAEGAGAPAGGKQDGPAFGNLLRDAVEGAIDTLHSSEAASRQAAMGKADLNDVVLAVSKAELTLQTVVSIRDRAVQAYQDIMRMPI